MRPLRTVSRSTWVVDRSSLVAIPMVMPEILMGISLLILFATAGMSLGFTTVIIGHVTFSFPFVLVAVQARLQGLDPALEEAALDLGATPLKAFWLVIVPCLLIVWFAYKLVAWTRPRKRDSQPTATPA